jgi:hypothetical protein
MGPPVKVACSETVATVNGKWLRKAHLCALPNPYTAGNCIGDIWRCYTCKRRYIIINKYRMRRWARRRWPWPR